MKIALLYPLWTEKYGDIAHFSRAGIYPPLNLAFLAAYAESKGHNVIIIDGEAEGLPIDEMVKRVMRFNPDLIGITATTPFFHISVELGNALKRVMNVPICIGGPHISVLKEKSFEKCFDFAFIGEADVSWNLFLEMFESNENIKDVKGILFREKNEVIFTGYPDTFEDINKIEIPARHLLKNELYNIATVNGLKKFTSIMTVRGCPFDCIFCSTKTFGKDIRRRNPELVIQEINGCIEKYGIRHFVFLDGTLTLHRQHILDICNLIIKDKLNITFEGGTRANLIDDELIKKMKDAGCIRLGFGLETVDEAIRETIKKRVPLESYVEANKLTNKYGIESLNPCIIGLPGESYESIKKTLAFLRRSKDIKQANMSIAVPYPGTELFEMAKKGEKGLILETEDFTQYRRYDASVMTVGELTPEILLDIQNEAYASIYLAPWRWETMIRKFGPMGALLTFNRLVKCLKRGNTRFLTNKQLGIEEG